MSYGAAFCGKSGEIQSKWKLLAGMSREVGGTPTRAKAKKGEKFWREQIEGVGNWRIANVTGIDREIWNWRSAKLRWLSGSAIGDMASAGQIFGRFE